MIPISVVVSCPPMPASTDNLCIKAGHLLVEGTVLNECQLQASYNRHAAEVNTGKSW